MKTESNLYNLRKSYFFLFWHFSHLFVSKLSNPNAPAISHDVSVNMCFSLFGKWWYDDGRNNSNNIKAPYQHYYYQALNNIRAVCNTTCQPHIYTSLFTYQSHYYNFSSSKCISFLSLSVCSTGSETVAQKRNIFPLQFLLKKHVTLLSKYSKKCVCTPSRAAAVVVVVAKQNEYAFIFLLSLILNFITLFSVP